jgi:hypothetical protein
VACDASSCAARAGQPLVATRLLTPTRLPAGVLVRGPPCGSVWVRGHLCGVAVHATRDLGLSWYPTYLPHADYLKQDSCNASQDHGTAFYEYGAWDRWTGRSHGCCFFFFFFFFRHCKLPPLPLHPPVPCTLVCDYAGAMRDALNATGRPIYFSLVRALPSQG